MTYYSTPSNVISGWDSVPNEVVLKIFSHLPIEDLLRISTVSRRWNELSNFVYSEIKEISIYNRSRLEPIEAIRKILVRFKNLEKVNFSGFHQGTQLNIFFLLDITSSCKNIVEINVTRAMMPLCTIASIYDKLKVMRGTRLRFETRKPSCRFLKKLKKVETNIEVHFSTKHCKYKASTWFFEIETIPIVNSSMYSFYGYHHIVHDVYYRTIYECDINNESLREIVIGFPPERGWRIEDVTEVELPEEFHH